MVAPEEMQRSRVNVLKSVEKTISRCAIYKSGIYRIMARRWSWDTWTLGLNYPEDLTTQMKNGGRCIIFWWCFSSAESGKQKLNIVPFQIILFCNRTESVKVHLFAGIQQQKLQPELQWRHWHKWPIQSHSQNMIINIWKDLKTTFDGGCPSSLTAK